MVELVPPRLKQVLSERLADSMRAPLLQWTPRRVFGAVQLPSKAVSPTYEMDAEREVNSPIITAGSCHRSL